MEKRDFEMIAIRVLHSLPAEFQDNLENVAVVVEDWATPGQLVQARLKYRMSLLGLYEGIPLTERGRGYSLVSPDKITLFQKPIEARCRSDVEIEQEIRRVLRHEVGHYFGLDEGRLREIEVRKPKRRSQRPHDGQQPAL